LLEVIYEKTKRLCDTTEKQEEEEEEELKKRK